MISTPDLSAQDLVQLCDKARTEFYLRPKYIATKAKQVIASPEERTRIIKASKVFFKNLKTK